MSRNCVPSRIENTAVRRRGGQRGRGREGGRGGEGRGGEGRGGEGRGRGREEGRVEEIRKWKRGEEGREEREGVGQREGRERGREVGRVEGGGLDERTERRRRGQEGENVRSNAISKPFTHLHITLL